MALLCSAQTAFAEGTLKDRLVRAREAEPDTQTAQLVSVLEQSLEAYERVKDYKAVFHKQEQAQGSLGERETLFLKFEKPFKIFLHWFDTHKKGLQVLYERGRHDGKLAIHKPGLLLGLVPVVFLEQSSPWVREGSESYNIEDAGIGTFLHDFSEMVLKGLEEKKIQAEVTSSPEGANVDASFPGSGKGGAYFASRVEVFFDAKTHLPVRMRLYDWQGALTGVYEYSDLALNVGPDDPEFQRLAQRKLYRLYSPPVRVPQRNNFSPKN